MDEYSTTLHGSDPSASPSSLRAESPSTILPRPQRLLPFFMKGLGLGLLLVPLVAFVLARLFPYVWNPNFYYSLFSGFQWRLPVSSSSA